MKTITHGNQSIYLMPGYTAVDDINIQVLENGDTEISIDNGPTISIKGDMKHVPTVVIDSGEYAARLVVRSSESEWAT
jgi:hypothetical protein